MNYNFDDYLNVVKLNIKNKKLHVPICTELESHLQDSADFYVEIGYDEATANEKALADMGEPAVVGESMAKLHKLSAGQTILMILFCVFAILKICDLLGGCWLEYEFEASGFFSEVLFARSGSFFLFSDSLVFICMVVTGFVLALHTKRSAPIWLSVVVTLLEVRSIWAFSFISYMSVCGRLDEYLTAIREYDGTVPFGVSEYIVPIIIAFLILSALFFSYVCTIKYIDKAFCDGRKTKRIATVIMAVLLITSVCIYTGVYLYIDKCDKVQFESYSRVVSDICDLCLENGTMTADDFDMIKDRFSYLDFKAVDPREINNTFTNCDTILYAETGKSTMVVSGLYLGKSSSGALYLDAYVSGIGFDLKPSLFYVLNLMTFDNRWEASSDTVDSMIEMFGSGLDEGDLKEGDSLEEYLDNVKETSSHIKYEYYQISDYSSEFGEKYSTELVESGAFGFSNFHIYADDGNFSSATVILD